MVKFLLHMVHIIKRSYEITVVCMPLTTSADQFNIFLRSHWLVFSDFLYERTLFYHLRTDRAYFYRKFIFAHISTKRAPETLSFDLPERSRKGELL